MTAEPAFLRKLVAGKKSSFEKALEVNGLEVYFQKTEGPVNYASILEKDPHFRADYLRPIKDATTFYGLELSPFYLVIFVSEPPDPSLFASAYNDGAILYANRRNVALGWKWIAATTLTHEVGHISDSRARAEPIKLFSPDSLSEEHRWIRVEMERRVNESLPSDFKPKIATMSCLSLLSPENQIELLTRTSWYAPDTVPITITFGLLAERIYSLPSSTEWLAGFLEQGKMVDDEAYEKLGRAHSERNRNSIEDLFALKKDAFLLLDVLYDPSSETHEASIRPVKKRAYRLLRRG